VAVTPLFGPTGSVPAMGLWSPRAAVRHNGRPSVQEESKGSMAPILADYFPILVFIAIAALIGVALVGGSLLAARQKPYPEKVSAYECGFEAFDDARRRFDVRFYLVAILFIIFDLEVAFLFPWAVSLSEIGLFGFLSMIGFLAVLTVGFIYEWCKGALDWE
jgi:NADH-quinone oxidoreductase subunit A